MRLWLSLWMGFERTLAQFFFPPQFSWIWESEWGVESGLQQLNDPQWEAGTKYARRWLHWTPCYAIWEAYYEEAYLLQHQREDLVELEVKVKVNEKQEEGEVAEEPDIHDTGNDMGIFFIWGGTVSFQGIGHESKMVHKGCDSHWECNPELPCHPCWGKKRYYLDIPGSFFQEGRWNWIQQETRTRIQMATETVPS